MVTYCMIHFKGGQRMTHEDFFTTYILPHLDDVINYRKILFLSDGTVSDLKDLGLLKMREDTDRAVDSFIVSEEYAIRFHRYLQYVDMIKKGNDVLYQYIEEEIAKKRPTIKYI